jgi:hypothetical protein
MINTKTTVRVVTRASNGALRTKDYANVELLLQMHTRVGSDDCSTDLAVRGYPLFRGLIGPMLEGKEIVRYESSDVFESLTYEWAAARSISKVRLRMHTPPAISVGAGGDG